MPTGLPIFAVRSALPKEHGPADAPAPPPGTLSPVQSALAARDVAHKLKCLSLSNRYWQRRNRKHRSNEHQKRGEWKTHGRACSEPARVLLATLGFLWNNVFLKHLVPFELIFFQFILQGNRQPKVLPACRVSACRLWSFTVWSYL